MAPLYVDRSQAQSAPQLDNSQELFACSPVPCVLPPIRASEGGAEVTNPVVAADPLNQKQLLLGSEDANCQYGGAVFSSSDGGSVWNRFCLTQYIGVFQPGGDPMVAYDTSGVAYLVAGYGRVGYDTGLIGIQKSTDGVNWSKPVKALQEGLFPFEPSLAVDTNVDSPFVNAVYVSAVINTGGPYPIYVSHSSDGGMTWQEVKVVQFSGSSDVANTNLAVGKDGLVYLTWLYCPGTGPHANCAKGTEYTLMSKSADGGSTWSKPTLMTTITGIPDACNCWPFGPIPNTNVYASNIPVIGADDGTGPYSGYLYVVMYSWTGTYMRVVVIHSADGGTTWSKPVPVAPASDTHDQFFPWLSVSPTGLVGVSWLDRRNDPANIDYQAFAAISSDGGQSFPNVQLTTAFSNPNVNGYFDNLWMGNYTGNTWAGPNYFIAAWMDSSNGVDMQDVVGGIRLH